MFDRIARKVEEEVKGDEEEEEEPRAGLELDFMFDEFVNKNIRVRPIGKEGSERGGDSEEEEGGNYEQVAGFEMEEQRKAVKAKKR